jgi:hypothetical protein
LKLRGNILRKTNRKIKRSIKTIDQLKEKLQIEIQGRALTLFVLGKGFPKKEKCFESCIDCPITDCKEPKRRKEIKEKLMELGNNALFPEELKLIYPATEEQIIFQENDVDLLIILPEAWGSVSEFNTFSQYRKLAKKLRIFVLKQYHPLYGSDSNYLTDAYLTYLAEYGHVYYFQNDYELISIIEKLTECYRRICYLKMDH